MGQYLEGNNMAQIKIHNGGKYAHAQTSNAYNFCLSCWNSTKLFTGAKFPHRMCIKKFLFILWFSHLSKSLLICAPYGVYY